METSPVSTFTNDHISAKRLFRPFYTILSVFGLYYPTQGSVSETRRRLQIMYCATCNVLYWTGMVRFVFAFREPVLKQKGIVIINIAFFLYMSAIVLVVNWFTFVSSKCLPTVVNGLDQLHAKYGRPSYLNFSPNRLNQKIAIFLAINVSVVTVEACVLVTSDEVKKAQHWVMLPFVYEANPTMYWAFSVLYGVLFNLVTLAYTLLSMISLGLGYTLYKEFARVQETFSRVLSSPSTDISQALENVRLQYEDVVALLVQSNRLLSGRTLVHYALVIPYLCMNFYALLTQTYSIQLTIGSVSLMIILSGSLAVITTMGILINSKAHSEADTIMKFSSNEIPEKANMSLHVFLCRLTGTNVGLSAGGLFIVDKSVLLTMLGGFVTYLFVAFQFKVEDG